MIDHTKLFYLSLQLSIRIGAYSYWKQQIFSSQWSFLLNKIQNDGRSLKTVPSPTPSRTGKHQQQSEGQVPARDPQQDRQLQDQSRLWEGEGEVPDGQVWGPSDGSHQEETQGGDVDVWSFTKTFFFRGGVQIKLCGAGFGWSSWYWGRYTKKKIYLKCTHKI